MTCIYLERVNNYNKVGGNMKKVSIIVPCYNSEEYLDIAIKSLVKQTYKNIEIILLNDGSKDGTLDIMRSYDDERIVIIDKKNTGIGDTRNTGIRKSSGDYIMFLDSDDYYEEDTVENMVRVLEENDADMVVSNYYLNTPSKQLEIKFNDFGVATLKEKPEILTGINYAPWNKIYKREIAMNAEFPTNIKYEDVPFVVKCLLNSNRIAFTNEFNFHYVIKKSGETITRDERVFDIFKILDMVNQDFNGYDYIDATGFSVKILMSYLKNSRFIPDKDLQKRLIDRVFSYLDDLDKDWRKCEFLKQENGKKRFILTHKSLLKLFNKIKG